MLSISGRHVAQFTDFQLDHHIYCAIEFGAKISHNFLGFKNWHQNIKSADNASLLFGVSSPTY